MLSRGALSTNGVIRQAFAARGRSGRNGLPHFSHYHATARREILPVIGVAALAFVGVYSVRALRRMSEEQLEWEEYLADQEKKGGVKSSSNSSSRPNLLGIDIGTSTLKLSCLPSFTPTSSSDDKKPLPSPLPTIVENREGKFSTPSYVFFESLPTDLTADFFTNAAASASAPTNPPPIVGRLAAARLHTHSSNVISPRPLPSSPPTPPFVSALSLSLLLSDLLPAAVDKRCAPKTSLSSVVGVLTYPPSSSPADLEHLHLAATKAGLSDPYLVPEPVASLLGGLGLKLVKESSVAGKSVLVVDVGHHVSSVSLLAADGTTVKASQTLPLGGKLARDALVKYLADKFGAANGGIDVTKDGMSLQRLHDAAEEAVKELSTKSRAHISLPYLTASKAGAPLHLEEELSAKVMSQLLSDNVKDSDGQPASLSSVFSKTLLQLLTDGAETPLTLGCVLLVGGGSRLPGVQAAVKEGVSAMGGEDYAARTLVAVGSEHCEGVTALGAVLAVKE